MSALFVGPRNSILKKCICKLLHIAGMFGTLCIVTALLAGSAQSASDVLPDRITFMSADGHTTLVGYIFKPNSSRQTRTPAVVMMHGRAGAYSSLAKGVYNATTLSKRHEEWGHLWAAQGYIAILVDGFGPRGYPEGFSRGTYEDRPPELDEVNVRPLDAYGALAFLRSRRDVIADRVALHGWSNGGSATLATMSESAGITSPTPATGFRGGVAFYPACGLKGQFENGLIPYAPVRVFQGTADEEVSPKRCAELVDKSRARNGDITITLYEGATHDFDDPGTKRQSVPANVSAKKDATARALEFVAGLLSQ
jgi:carboxymethylenebutenolidase